MARQITVEPAGSRAFEQTLNLGFKNTGDSRIALDAGRPSGKRFLARRAASAFDETPAPVRPRPTPSAPRPSSGGTHMRRGDLNDMLGDFADPTKVRDDATDDDDFEESDRGDEGEFGDGGSDEGFGGEEAIEAVSNDGEEGGEDPLRPSTGFASIEDEKSDLLFKIQRFKKQGRFVSKSSFSIFSDIRELRSEVSRIRTEADLEASVKFQRKILLGACSAIEFGNKKFKLAKVHLDGWSGQMHSEIDSYDDVFEELYYKYRGKASTPPEIRLLMMVGGSAMMYNFSHQMFAAAMPQIQNVLQNNPDLVNSMAKAYAGSKTDEGGVAPGSGALNAAMEQRGGATGGRPMRGPGMDIGAMLGPMAGALNMTPPGSEPVGNDFLRAPAPSRNTDHARENPLFAKQIEDEDRFSDIISEDLESLPSIRSFGSSPGKRMRESTADAGPAKKKVVLIK
jgi:hypothetical protein